jgi:hypothetical protein
MGLDLGTPRPEARRGAASCCACPTPARPRPRRVPARGGDHHRLPAGQTPPLSPGAMTTEEGRPDARRTGALGPLRRRSFPPCGARRPAPPLLVLERRLAQPAAASSRRHPGRPRSSGTGPRHPVELSTDPQGSGVSGIALHEPPAASVSSQAWRVVGKLRQREVEPGLLMLATPAGGAASSAASPSSRPGHAASGSPAARPS